MENQDYVTNTYNALKSKVQGFDKTEQQYRELITSDPAYRANVHKALTAKVQGFSRTFEEFDTMLGVKKKDTSESDYLGGTSKSVNPNGDLALPEIQTPVEATPEVPAETIQSPTQSAMPEMAGSPAIPPDPETSYLQGPIKNAFKSTAGMLKTVGHAVDKLESTVGATVFGKDFEPARRAMKAAGIGANPFEKSAELIDNTGTYLQDSPDNLIGDITGAVGTIVPEIFAAYVIPGVKVGGWLAKYGIKSADKFAMFLAGKGAMEGVNDHNATTPMQQFTAPIKGAAEGAVLGTMYAAQGVIAGKVGMSIADKIYGKTGGDPLNRALVQGGSSVLSNGLLFAGYTGLEQMIRNLNEFGFEEGIKKFDPHEIAVAGGTGIALGAKDFGKLAFAKGLQSFIATPTEQLNKIAQSTTTPEQMKAMSDESLGKLNETIGKIQKSPINQFELNENIFAAQQRLGLPTEPEVQISPSTLETLGKLKSGEPVTNELLEQASKELYGMYKGLEGIIQSPTRKFTTDQIAKKTTALAGLIETLENTKRVQAENEAFVADQDKLAVQAAVDFNLSTLKAFTEEVIKNPAKVVEAVKESTLPEAAKQELIDKVNQVASDNDPVKLEIKPIEEKITKLTDELEKIEKVDEHPSTKKIKAEKVKRKIKEQEVKLTEILDPQAVKPGEGKSKEEVVAQPIPPPTPEKLAEMSKEFEEPVSRPEVEKASTELDDILKYRDTEISNLKKKEEKARKEGKQEVADVYKGQVEFYENIDIQDFKNHFNKNPEYYTKSNIDPFLRYQTERLIWQVLISL